MSGKSTAQIDAKREEFRKYLEKEGVLESLTKALVWLTFKKRFQKMANKIFFFQVALYEEPDKPNDALSFVRNNFASSELQTLKAQLENLSKENEELKNKVSTLEEDKSDLQKQVIELEQKLEKSQQVPASPKPTEEPTPEAIPPPPEGEASNTEEELKSPSKSDTVEDVPKSSEEAKDATTNDTPTIPEGAPVAAEDGPSNEQEQEPQQPAPEAMETETEAEAATSEPKTLEEN